MEIFGNILKFKEIFWKLKEFLEIKYKIKFLRRGFLQFDGNRRSEQASELVKLKVCWPSASGANTLKIFTTN